jgi:hypothetical protein
LDDEINLKDDEKDEKKYGEEALKLDKEEIVQDRSESDGEEKEARRYRKGEKGTEDLKVWRSGRKTWALKAVKKTKLVEASETGAKEREDLGSRRINRRRWR